MNSTIADELAPSLFGAYRPPFGVYDETMDAAGRVRAHWSGLLKKLEGMSPEALQERSEGAQQLLRDHGVSYNVVDEGWNAERPWKLDVLPMVISGEEWKKLEAGLIQRTHLMNLVLGDLYGPQRLLRDGVLPPAIVHANPGFIRQCHGIEPYGGKFLTLHAVDLTRAPNGKWWVLADRTQAPSGVGYTLENRIILSRMLPVEFHESKVQRIASFFLKRKNGLRAMAPWTDSPNVVLLTPGPYTATYFEHAYLARYLGYPLVEGSDLTVRDRKVFIKTINGLQRVDVIIRRVDDTYCDPVELRPDSFLGVPGLLDAARAGNVAISNALGSGAVEAPAILAFLPALAKRLLGEELRIPNVATWWGGQRKERDYIFSNLRRLVIKRAFVRGRGEPAFCENLDSNELGKLRERLRAYPHDFVGQEQVAVSTVPTWNGETVVPHPLILRCFVAATADGFTVLPGGLTRIAGAADSPIVASKLGGGNKDTWVLTDGPIEQVTLLDDRGRPKDHGYTAMVPSRVVDNLFWLGRYAERLEDQTRLFRTVLSRVAGEGDVGETAELDAMVRCLSSMEIIPEKYAEGASNDELSEVFRALVYDKEKAGSVRHVIARIGYLTASLRDRFSGDTWRILHQITTEFPAAPLYFTPGAALAALHRLIFQLAAFSGMEMENMTRGHAWRFLEIGRRLERANNLTMVLRAIITSGGGDAALIPLLEYSDSTMTYRRRYFARPELASVADLLLADITNPRSFAFQVNVLGRHLIELPDPTDNRPVRRKFAEMEFALNAADPSALGGAASGGNSKALEDLLERLIVGCWGLSDALTVHYFSHAQARVN